MFPINQVCGCAVGKQIIMKKILITATVLMVFGLQNLRADIAYQVASSGVYQPGGTWDGGPWTEPGFLYQAIWSDVYPSGHVPGPGGSLAYNGGAQEFILFQSNGVHGYGYIQYADQPASATQHTDSDVGGNNINNGYLYFRLFPEAVPSYSPCPFIWHETLAIDTSTLDDVDLSNPPINPGSIVQINLTGGEHVEMSRIWDCPEPETLSLLALSCLVFVVRGSHRD